MNTVAKVMKEAGIRAKMTRRFVRTTDSRHRLPVSENVLDRDFTATKPNPKWVMDLTDVPTLEGWLFLAVVVDLFSRRIVGWAMDATMTSRRVADALSMAVSRRGMVAGVIAHSDRGSQYASDHFQAELRRHRMVGSMSGVGQCWDNAVIESTFGRLKTDPTATASRRRRCRAGYNSGDHVSVGLAGVGPLLPGVPHPHRRSRTMSDRPAPIPPRA